MLEWIIHGEEIKRCLEGASLLPILDFIKEREPSHLKSLSNFFIDL